MTTNELVDPTPYAEVILGKRIPTPAPEPDYAIPSAVAVASVAATWYMPGTTPTLYIPATLRERHECMPRPEYCRHCGEPGLEHVTCHVRWRERHIARAEKRGER